VPDDDQVTANLAVSNEPPSAQHWLGTDPTGYDELGRLMYGGQASLEVGIAAALLATVFGTLYGAVSGYVGGAVDATLMRLVDGLLAVPALFLLLVLDRALDLTGQGPDRPARHHTLRRTIAWSVDLLTPTSRIVFRRLGVFVGGADLAAVSRLAADHAALTSDSPADPPAPQMWWTRSVTPSVGCGAAWRSSSTQAWSAWTTTPTGSPASGCWRPFATTLTNSSATTASSSTRTCCTPSTTRASPPPRTRS